MIQLPPLPEPKLLEGLTLSVTGKTCGPFDGYTADQLRADRLAVIEACAQALTGVVVGRNELCGPAGRYAKGSAMDSAMRQCAAALRALKEQA